MTYNKENYDNPKHKVSTIVLVLLIFILLAAATIISTTAETPDEGDGGYNSPVADDTELNDSERVSYSTQENGSIAKTASYTQDGEVISEYTLKPQGGYMINAVTVDGKSVPVTAAQGKSQTLSFSSGTGSHSISVSFEKIYIVLSANGGNPELNVTVTYGAREGTGENARPKSFVLSKTSDTSGTPTHPNENKEFYYFSSVSNSDETGLKGGKRFDLGINYTLPEATSTSLFATFLTPTENWKTPTQYVVVPNGVERIECDADFSGQNCNFLNSQSDNSAKTVTLPASATVLSDNAFRNCEALRAVVMSDYTRIIGSAVFSNTSIQEFFINDENLYYSVDSQKLLLNKSGTILYCAPAFGTQSTTITLPSTLTSIEPYAFSGSPSASIVVAEGSTTFKTTATGLLLSSDGTTLVVCPKGKSGVIAIPDSVTRVVTGALQHCKYVTGFDFSQCSVSIFNSLEFDGCTQLAYVTPSSGLISVGANAFNGCTQLVSFGFSAATSLKTIGTGAFRGCSSLQNVAIPSTVTTVSEYAFAGCSALAAVTLSPGMSAVSAHCFENCTSLVFPVFPASVISIGQNAFAGCTSIGETLQIPSTVKEIDNEAFYNCSGITTVVLPLSVTELGGAVFGACNSPVIYVAATAKPLGWNDNWNRDVGTIHWGS